MLFTKKQAIKSIDNRISEFCYHELKKVEVKKKVGLFNHKCFWNSANYASVRNDCDVVMGIYFNKISEDPRLHFWCRHNEKDIEVSMGYLAESYNYYELKIIKPSDYLIIDSVFSDAMDYYREKLTTPWERFLIGKYKIL